MADQIQKSEQQWRSELTPEEFHVLREAGTEPPGSSAFEELDDAAFVYSCRGCGAELFRSEAKFEARCGWPAFYEPLAEDRVEYVSDHSLGMARVEVRCASCRSHLGHVFSGEGFPTPTDQRYCINGIALAREARD